MTAFSRDDRVPSQYFKSWQYFVCPLDNFTCLALTVLLDEISNAFNNDNIKVGLFLNLKKAFDTIDHNISKRKLYIKYGIRGISLELIHSYLSNRKQYVL